LPGHQSREDVLSIVRRVLAADCACDEAAFDLEQLSVVPAADLPGRRRFKHLADPLIVTMGRGVVLAASDGRMEWLQEQFGALDREDVFSAETLGKLVGFAHRYSQIVEGPDLKYTCSRADLHPIAQESLSIIALEGQDVLDLYEYPGFVNALQYDADHPQPDVLATLAMLDGAIVGMAGASADSDDLWQIGIDVLPSARGLGLGRNLVTMLTEAIFDHGRVPYYSTSPSNIASRRLARCVGFWPAWTEIRVMDRRD
jgi:GNAT superfamily N-acetyltransferase